MRIGSPHLFGFLMLTAAVSMVSCSKGDFLDGESLKQIDSVFATVIFPDSTYLSSGGPQAGADSVTVPDTVPVSSPDAPKVTYHTIMSLNGNASPHPQGGDCWGDYFFQFSTNNRIIRIYDLAGKKLLQNYEIKEADRGFVSNCHCNTVCFGSDYYTVKDEFPLLYVSTGYTKNNHSGALVYRITREDQSFTFTLVQTLRFPIINKTSWTEFIPAESVSYLLYGRTAYIIKTPSVEMGDVTFSPKDTVATTTLSPRPTWLSTSRGQDRCRYQGHLLEISGVPDAGEESVFIVYDINSGSLKAIIDFKEMGIKTESESIFLWKDKICIAFTDRIVELDLKSAVFDND